MLNLYVIGCGGIGGFLCERLLETIASSSLDIVKKVYGEELSKQFLQDAGKVAIPLVVDSLTLVDGDVFEPKNAIRQGAGAGSKISHNIKRLIEKPLAKTYLQNLTIKGIASYINPQNMTSIIPLNAPVNKDNMSCIDKYINEYKKDQLGRFKSTTVIFMGVDNHKTRYELSKYAERFDNVLVINGGNDKVTGHVTVYERANGVALDPNLYEVYPDVAAGLDKRPDEVACGDITPEHNQIATTNSFVANLMMVVFDRWIREGLTLENGRRRNEIKIDLDSMLMSSKHNK